MMIRLNVVVEGDSEELFVVQVLRPHLAERGVMAFARMVTTSRGLGRAGRGGVTSYAKIRGDLMRWMREDRGGDARFTTMFDRYGLPLDFPGMSGHGLSGDAYTDIGILEREFASDINDFRFLPYLQLHEFEALILTDPGALLTVYPEAEEAVAVLIQRCAEVRSPELVNLDNPPARCIQAAIPRFRKKACAGVVTQNIGLPRMRAVCPHFSGWLERLETLAGEQARETQ